MKLNALKIRKARPSDLGDILALIRDHEKADVPFANKYYQRYFSRDSLLARDSVFVSEIDKKVIGVAGHNLDVFSSDCAFWLSWFIVAPEYRGLDNGLVAAKMLSHVIRRLKRLGAEKVFAATLSSDGRAVKLYLKQGFELEARLIDYYFRNEDQLILSKYL